MLRSLRLPTGLMGICWLLELLERAMRLPVDALLRMCPRDPDHLQGIVGMHFAHVNLPHLISNTFPFIVLGAAMGLFYRPVARRAMLFIYIISGILMWLFARGHVCHIGASGVIYGFAAFLFFSGWFRKSRKAIAVSLLVVLLYGGMVYGMVPGQQGVSWDGHLIGAIAGLLGAWRFSGPKRSK